MTGLPKRCELTELLADQCAHCRGSDTTAIDQVAEGDIGFRFEAKYPGTCANCDGRIREGDVIARFWEGGYACTECLP